jgi:hypothetical protein
LLDPDADRWVLVDAAEAAGRLLVAVGRPGAAVLLDCSAAIRSDIHQPVAPTELGDLETTLARSRQADDDHEAGRPLDPGDVAGLHARILQLTGEIGSGSSTQPSRRAGE